MIILYNFLILLLRGGVNLASRLNPKAKSFVEGRKGILKKLEEAFMLQPSPIIWVHCASLGEFEQARPVMELIKTELPEHKILLTFFSPSGYEIRKNYNGADFIFYLPWDTTYNAVEFISITKPVLAIFIKYEFWFHYTNELKNKNIPIISVSSIFRKEQLFFQSYGGFYRDILKKFSFFFVQNDKSVQLLRSIGIRECVRAGDTRFDRVYQIVKQGTEIPIAKAFKGSQKVFVVGSCWPEDLDVIVPLVNENRIKFIIAPHEISESTVVALEKSLQVKHIRFSAATGKNLDEHQVLIIDNIGMLSRLYRYGEFAFVGGAFGKGLHNILEAACYGIPIFFGNKNFEKYQEAVDLINRGGAFEISSYPDLRAKYGMLNVPESFLLACEVTRQYVEENLGATEKIMKYCRELLAPKPVISRVKTDNP